MSILLSIWGFFRSGIGKVVAIALAVLGAAAVIYRKGRSDQKQKHRVKDLETANEVRKRGANARRKHDEDTRDATHSDLVDRLRRKGRLRDE